jgi:hypothetical protein
MYEEAFKIIARARFYLVPEPHHFDAALAPGKIFDAALVAPALQRCLKY